ncbi:PEGA domain-containing protein [Patescibacteria group bacterium]|nr:PEGA domain-containing protein [Patescibacteria group bacterium]MBU1029544.1 PEGA domain-containing protein [Patescibacteria group bacterium]MBU1915542.1 PEGA domain-containing protein [Patescibacteria group bacterium]
MSHGKRQLIVILLVAIFAIVAPTVLLFASGYSYNWHKHRIEKTGILYINAEPATAEVYVNGKKIRGSIPVSVPRLLPEDYLIEVRLSEYFPWSKTLTIKSGQTTFAKTITLIRNVLPRLDWRAEVTNSTFSANASAVAYIATNESWSELFHYDLKTKQTLLLARFGQDKYSKLDLHISPNGSRILLSAIDAITRERIVIIYKAELGSTAVELKELARLSAVRWSWSVDSSILALLGPTGLIFVDNDQTVRRQPLALNAVRDLMFGNRSLWLLSETVNSLKLFQASLAGQDALEIQIALPTKNYRFVSGNDRLLWLNDSGNKKGLAIRIDDLSWRQTSEIQDIRWEQTGDNGRLLLWNDFEIFLFDPNKSDEPSLITRLGTPINDVAWHPAGTYALFTTATGVTAIELDGRDHRNIVRLVEFGSVDSVTINAEEKLLYFIGSVGNQRGLYERPL